MCFYFIMRNTFWKMACVPLKMAAAAKPTFWFGASSRTLLGHCTENSASYFSLSKSRKPVFLFPLQIDLRGARSCVVSGLWKVQLWILKHALVISYCPCFIHEY